jgi:hypothetical protein
MPRGLRKIHISVGERNLTHFGGIFLIHRFCKKLKLKWWLQKRVRFPQRSSPYHPADLILAIVYAIIVGVHRLSRTKMLQGNGAFQRIIGLEHYPYSSSLRRFLKRADARTLQDITRVHDQLRLKMFNQPKPRTSLILDFDSTVLTIYGKQIEEAKVGYNPHKRGARSYHPLLCFEFNTKDFWHGVLRPGNVYTSAGGQEFLRASLEKIPPGIYRVRVRADSGFFDREFIEPLDEKGIGYVIVAKMTTTIKRKLDGLRYHRFKGGWQAAEFHYTPLNWKTRHRFVVIRRPLPQKDTEQLTLFAMKRWAYQVFVTNVPLAPENIWYFYRGRAAIETLIKELKESYSLAKIPTNNFMANQAYFCLLLLAYNIVNWFRRICLPLNVRTATLQTIRTEFLVLPARLTRSGNRNVLRLPAEYIKPETMKKIMKRINAFRLR